MIPNEIQKEKKKKKFFFFIKKFEKYEIFFLYRNMHYIYPKLYFFK